MLTFRAYAALALIGLVTAVALLLIDRGRIVEQRNTARDGLVAAGKALRQAELDLKVHAVREGETAGQSAQQCAAEGSTAFERGRAFGRAEALNQASEQCAASR